MGRDTYTGLAEKYQRNKYETPLRKYMEVPSYLRLMEGIKNEDIIDLACGTGCYTRMFRERTSGKVYGIDISKDMINLAKSQVKAQEDITYLQ